MRWRGGVRAASHAGVSHGHEGSESRTHNPGEPQSHSLTLNGDSTGLSQREKVMLRQ